MFFTSSWASLLYLFTLSVCLASFFLCVVGPWVSWRQSVSVSVVSLKVGGKKIITTCPANCGLMQILMGRAVMPNGGGHLA